MTGFLKEIVEAVRHDVALPDYRDGLPSEPRGRPYSFRAGVENAPEHWALIVERKHRSPGSNPPELPVSPIGEFTRIGGASGATAFSCLATRPSFGGSPLEVYRLTERTRVPVLFKDFVLGPLQIDAARRAGASALLLIARLETGGYLDRPLAELADAAHAAGLEVLLELHAPEEVKVAERVRADLYGVNVRDLDTLAFRPDVAERTFGALAGRGPILGLSGVEGPEEARRFLRWGAAGIVVGTAFARSADPPAFLHSLRSVAGGKAR